jgi:triacylglycerol lipase
MIIPKLRSPIVLVHGLFGFDRLKVAGATLVNYFPGIADLLESAGNRVLVPALTPTAGVAVRAGELKMFLLEYSPNEPVHIIAHSMGGLDSRYMISCLGMEKHVLSLTTLGTPHRGTSFADWGIGKLERIVKPILYAIGLPYQGFYDLTRQNCKTFNETVPDVPDVRYFSVAGRHDGHLFHPEWLLPYHIVKQQEGDNDGVVAVESARYGEELDLWDGDHLGMVNWFNPLSHYRGAWRDPRQRYGMLLRRLADLGY